VCFGCCPVGQEDPLLDAPISRATLLELVASAPRLAQLSTTRQQVKRNLTVSCDCPWGGRSSMRCLCEGRLLVRVVTNIVVFTSRQSAAWFARMGPHEAGEGGTDVAGEECHGGNLAAGG